MHHRNISKRSTLLALLLAPAVFSSADVVNIDTRTTIAQTDPWDPELDRIDELLESGKTLARNGDFDPAQRVFEDALRLSEDLAERWTDAIEVQRGVTISLLRTGDSLFLAEDYTGSITQYEAAMAHTRSLQQRHSGDLGLINDLQIGYSQLARVYERLDQRTLASEGYRRALDMALELQRQEPEVEMHAVNVAIGQQRLGAFLQYQGRTIEGLELLSSAVATIRAWQESSPTDTGRQESLAVHLDFLGGALWDLGRLEQAGAAYEESITLLARLVRLEPNNHAWLHRLADGLLRYARVLNSRSEWVAAAKRGRQAHAINLRRVAANPANDRTKADLSRSFQRQAESAQGLNKLDDAREYFEQSLILTRELAEARPDVPERLREWLVTLWGYAFVLPGDAFADKLDAVLEETLSVCRSLAEISGDSMRYKTVMAPCHQNVGDSRAASGDFEAAASHYQIALDIMAREDPDSSVHYRRQRAALIWRLAGTMEAQGNTQSAYDLAQGALADFESAAQARPEDSSVQIQLSRFRDFVDYLKANLDETGPVD